MAFWERSGKRVERRSGPRLKPEGLLAHYWTGGISKPCPVLEIGLFGAVIASRDVYYPGTTIRFALEDAATDDDAGRISHTGVWGKVVRNVDGGFCVAFVFETRGEWMEFRRFVKQLGRRGLNETNGNKER